MIEQNTLKQTCWGCPSSWRGKTKLGEEVYIRFRWGTLTVDVNDELVYSENPYGEEDNWSGVMSESEMIEYINSESPNVVVGFSG